MGSKTKRRSLFNYLKKQKADISLLQETHLETENMVKQWELEWGGKVLTSFGKSNARGVAILMHPKTNCDIDKINMDSEGRILCCEVKYDNRKIIVANLYAPNEDDPEFFESVIRTIETYEDRDLTILGGDFNLVMNPKIDRLNSEYNHERSCKVLKEYCDRSNLVDAWRVLNPEQKRFTWHRLNRNRIPVSSRIDMLFVNEGMLDCVSRCNIEVGHLTDHSLINMTIKLDNYTRGPGTWRLNTKLLENSKYCDGIANVIERSDHCSPFANPNEKWEFMKMNICARS